MKADQDCFGILIQRLALSAVAGSLSRAPRSIQMTVCQQALPAADQYRAKVRIWRRCAPSAPAPRRIRPILLHRRELEAAGVPLVECFHLPRLHIPGKVDGEALRTDR